MQILNATGLHRKSGGAQWRDLRFLLSCYPPVHSKDELEPPPLGEDTFVK
jgi:hypothetical protein